MSSLNVRLPDSLHDQVRQLAKQDNISINQFISLAVAEKISALMTLDYIEQRAQKGSRQLFDQVLNKVAQADLEVDAEDRIPEGMELALPQD